MIRTHSSRASLAGYDPVHSEDRKEMEMRSCEKSFRRGSRRAGLLALMVAWTCVSAYGQKVTYDWDKDVDFTPYRTYAWVPDLPGKAAVPSTDERIRGNIDVQLQVKGLELAPDAKAALYVSYQVTSDKGQIVSFNPDGQWRPSLSPDAKPSAGTMVKGALIVDLYDRQMKKLVWRGIVSGAFESRQEANYRINKGLAKLFTYYPPPPPK
jgi:uncharacterized protein DUF4136